MSNMCPNSQFPLFHVSMKPGEDQRADLRTVGLLTSVWAATENEGELAAVFLPRGADSLKGYIHVVSRDKVRFTDWTVKEYLAYQMSFGAVVPHPVAPNTGETKPQK